MGALKTETIVVLGVALAVVYLSYKAAGAVSSTASDLWKKASDVVSTDLNPTSDQNLAYQGASSLARWLSGQESGDLASIAYDYMHKAEPSPANDGTLVNYTAADAAAQKAFNDRLDFGMNHGL